mgnify:CR=1 FL=1
MSRQIRAGYTQAILNLSSWKFLVLEILVIAIWLSAYLESIYVLVGVITLAVIVFLNTILCQVASILISFFWASLGAFISRGINIFNNEIFMSLESFISIFASPISQAIAFLLFIVSYIYHVSVAGILRDIIFSIIPRRRRSKKLGFNKDEI